MIKIGDMFDSLRSTKTSSRWRVDGEVDSKGQHMQGTGLFHLTEIARRVGPPPASWRENRRKASAIDRFADWPLEPVPPIDVRVVSREVLENSSDYAKVEDSAQQVLITEPVGISDPGHLMSLTHPPMRTEPVGEVVERLNRKQAIAAYKGAIGPAVFYGYHNGGYTVHVHPYGDGHVFILRRSSNVLSVVQAITRGGRVHDKNMAIKWGVEELLKELPQ